MKLSLLACMLIAAGLNTAVVAAQQAEQAQAAVEQEHRHEHDHDHQDGHGHDDMPALGAHVHGHAVLTLVLEGNEMQLAFQSAAQSIVGFEHKPRTPEQKQEVSAAIEVFNQAQWFSFNTDANCELVMAEASTDLTEPQANKGHADFYANYQLLCQRPARLDELQLSIFSLVPMLEHMDIQWIINGRQGASQAALSSSSVRF
jgi:ABC-type Zn2+ transport system substrate-binding protein/surface adhesin